MPDTTPASGGGGGGFGATLKAKWGPLPVWAWLALITIAGLSYWLYEQHKAGASSATQATSNAGQPGVVVINQDDQDADATQPPPEPKHGGHGGGVPEDPHKVTRAEARTLMKEHHTVYTRNRGGTYVPVESLSGVHNQLYVGERAWDIWQKQSGGGGDKRPPRPKPVPRHPRGG